MNVLSPLQEKLLEMFDWFHNFCVNNSLTYYAIGGTMLGAIRHRGFIPWDDDVDVGMPREDYERFLRLIEGKIIDHYTAESFHSGNADYVFPFAKLYDTSTTLVEQKRKPIIRGVYLDVFPIDGVGQGFIYKLRYKFFRIEKNILSVVSADINEHRSKVNNLVILSTRMIPESICDHMYRILLRRIDSFCRLFPFDSDVIANLVGSRKEKEPMDRSYFGSPILYQFEGLEIYGVEKPHEYLSWLIGDYMSIPPEDERVAHYVERYDLLHGYL